MKKWENSLGRVRGANRSKARPAKGGTFYQWRTAVPDNSTDTTIRHHETNDCTARHLAPVAAHSHDRQVEKGVPPQPKNDQHCEQQSVKREGNKIRWTMECPGEHPVSGTGMVMFDSRQHYRGNSTVHMTDSRHSAISMKQSYSGKWRSSSCEKQ